MELLEGLLQKDKDEFKRICNRLLSSCFLCKRNQNSRSDYYFVLKYRDKFRDYLDVLGFRLEINEDYGVIQLTNPQNYNRLNLKLYESIILLILRILYDEKKRELSVSDEVIINLGDIQDRYLSLKIREKMIDKTTMRNAMSLFRRFQLVETLDKEENMKQAQGEFKNLNRALKDIIFSNEQYEFQFMPSRKYRSYYEMIMDDFNVIQGQSIFSGIFHENHKEVIEELFERLALNNESSTKTLDEFTDYRTYMDYDIKIIHTDGNFSYYSKVCEEKSGGETQTPFYVTVAASFVQLYTNNIGGEAAGLVMFDEAFNNMDDERIGGVLEFLNRLPLQMIIAAPPDKIQYIGPSMEETLLVMTDEKVSFVEEYYHAL